MLQRVFSGTLLSIGCILAAQAAERGLDVILTEANTAIASTAVAATPVAVADEACEESESSPCALAELFANDPDLYALAHADCVNASHAGIHLPGGTL